MSDGVVGREGKRVLRDVYIVLQIGETLIH